MTTDQEPSLRIISLTAENVKRLKAIRITPDKRLTRIEGKNAAGKSTVLDCISAAIGGSKWQPDVPVRLGERKAYVILETGEITVTRKWTVKGHTSLEVTDAKGTPVTSPQTILTKLFGDLGNDPVAFIRMAPKEQEKILKRLVGLDFDEVDTKRATAYANRTVANRQLKEAEARCGTVPDIARDAVAIDIAELANKQRETEEHNRAIDLAQLGVDIANGDVARAEKDVERAQQGLEKAATLLEAAQLKRTGMERLDAGDLSTKLTEAVGHNELVEARKAWVERNSQVAKLQNSSEALTELIAQIDVDKAERLREAKFPLKGLSIGFDGVVLNDLPLSQASSAEQLRCAVAICLADNHRGRVVLIRDGSLLDDSSMDDLHRIAEEFDAQIFVERVAEKASPSAVYIEDGEVQS